MLSAQLYMENPDDNLNFSIYKRPPPLKYRASGKLLGILAASIIVSLAYPTYQFAYHTFLSIKAAKETSEYNELFQKTSAIRQELAQLKAEKEKVDALVNNETTKFEFRKKLLSEIYHKKISYPMKALMLLEIFQLSNQNGCKVEAIEFKKKQLNFFVRNQSEKRITEFIKDLTALKKYKINTEKIEQDDKIKLYTSKISIGLNDE